jgi:hypothetical protein
VALTRHFGNVDLNQTSNRNAVYFDLFGSRLVNYSSIWVIPLTVLSCVAFAGLLILGFRKQKLTTRGILRGSLSLFVSILVASLAGWLLWRALWLIQEGPSPEALQSRVFLLGFVAFAVATASVVYHVMRKSASIESLAVGTLLWWLLLTLIVSLRIPGGSFLFHWPLLVSMVGLGWIILVPENKRISNMVLLGLCAVPAIILWVPVIYQIFVGLTLNWIPFTIAMVVLLFGLLVPLFGLIAASFRRLAPAVAAIG